MTPEQEKIAAERIDRIKRAKPGPDATVQEKIKWLNSANLSKEKIRCVDKITAKEYAKEVLGDRISVAKTLSIVGPSASDILNINLDELPKSFLLKKNAGCRTNYICRNKASFDKAKLSKMAESWMRGVPGINSAEFQYCYVNPMLFTEECLIGESGDSLVDYRLWVFNGKCRFISVNAGFGWGAIQYFDPEFKPLWFSNGAHPPDNKEVFEKPRNLYQMVEMAEELSAPFKFVRVDLYNIDGVVYLGEFTFSPGGYSFKLVDKSGRSVDREVGKWLEI